MDCSKPITDLTPSEAWQCFWQADDWRIIAANLRHVWAGFIGTTIGEWGEIILALAMLPAQFASYAWPFILLRYMIIRSRAGYIVPQWFGAYMVVAGGFFLLENARRSDNFFFYQRSWIVICGLSILLTAWVFGSGETRTL